MLIVAWSQPNLLEVEFLSEWDWYVFVAIGISILFLVVWLVIVMGRTSRPARQPEHATQLVHTGVEEPRHKEVDVLVMEAIEDDNLREMSVCAMDLLCRYGGWLIGSSPQSNMKLSSKHVSLRHVRLHPAGESGAVKVEHLKSGRPASVALNGKDWLAPGHCETLHLPAKLAVGDVCLLLSIKKRKV